MRLVNAFREFHRQIRPRVESYVVKGTQIQIIVQTSINLTARQRILKLIKEGILLSDKINNIPKIVFVIRNTLPSVGVSDVASSGLAYANFQKGTYRIDLNASHMLDSDDKEVSALIDHEITHLWQEVTSQMLTARDQAILKLKVQQEKMLKRAILPKELDLKEIRLTLLNFLLLLRLEGQAQYDQRIISEKLRFEQSHLEWYYSQVAKHSALNLASTWNEYLQSVKQRRPNDKVMDSLGDMYLKAYDLGGHMIFTILYYDKEMSREKIAKMGIFRFVKLYEKAIHETLGHKPLVSATSKQGIIDYSKMVSEWWQAVQSVKN